MLLSSGNARRKDRPRLINSLALRWDVDTRSRLICFDESLPKRPVTVTVKVETGATTTVRGGTPPLPLHLTALIVEEVQSFKLDSHGSPRTLS